MSFEGYYQCLCKNGHYSERDVYQYDSDKYYCHIKGCNQPHLAWSNLVDTTNGSFEGKKRIDGYVDLKKNAQRKCKCCGSVLEVNYFIPRKGRTK